MKVFLGRNGSVSREKWIVLSEGGCFPIGEHCFRYWEAWSLGERGKDIWVEVALRAVHGHEKDRPVAVKAKADNCS